MNTGIRPGEIRKFKWQYIDRKTGFIRLPAEVAKEKAKKAIPINHHVEKVFDSLVRHIDHDFVFTFGGYPITSPARTTGGLQNYLQGGWNPLRQK